uniref:Uncharacterized protein n=1 Tax=Arundo donax TaxID=35708 RepID=A0A0A9H8X3_ARUDO
MDAIVLFYVIFAALRASFCCCNV